MSQPKKSDSKKSKCPGRASSCNLEPGKRRCQAAQNAGEIKCHSCRHSRHVRNARKSLAKR